MDKYLFYSVCFLIGVGIVFSYSLSTYTVLYFGYSDFHFFARQAIVGILCIGMIFSFSFFNPDRHLHILGISIFIFSLFLMSIMHFLPESMVTSAGGARRWIRLPGFSLAPVEFFKVGFIYFLAWSFNRKLGHKKRKVLEEFKVLFPYFAIFILIIYLIAIMQNDLGQIVVLAFTFAFMALFAGASAKFFALLTSGIVSVAMLFIFTSPHRILRIKSWWSNIQDMVLSVLPESFSTILRVENLVEPYQISHSLNAIHNGGIFGQGLGNGIFKLGYLSEVHTDFVLAGIAEELGLISLVFITSIVFFVIYRILRIANRIENRVFYLFSFGIGSMLGFSFLMNAYGITSITPIKGIAVPFLSYGGSSLIASSLAIGLVIMISKKTSKNFKKLGKN
ncbi:MAG: Cell division protein FtsW [uncultured Campylobacterales bacterium]|uniref:Probable peptidoglycan glycosyltransferase FtsW n=1 Tax=uncultured Campylobacterales bacterium TaxID=352960 RepID=A0A6S6STJ7_9BACT|nr:MAG: Cell division protein FtsW [uncultured Campylobacterales bacterium]